MQKSQIHPAWSMRFKSGHDRERACMLTDYAAVGVCAMISRDLPFPSNAVLEFRLRFLPYSIHGMRITTLTQNFEQFFIEKFFLDKLCLFVCMGIQ